LVELLDDFCYLALAVGQTTSSVISAPSSMKCLKDRVLGAGSIFFGGQKPSEVRPVFRNIAYAIECQVASAQRDPVLGKVNGVPKPGGSWRPASPSTGASWAWARISPSRSGRTSSEKRTARFSSTTRDFDFWHYSDGLLVACLGVIRARQDSLARWGRTSSVLAAVEAEEMKPGSATIAQRSVVAKSIPALIKPELLVWARETAGYKPEEAADKLGVSAHVYAGWESGEPMSLPKLRGAARVFRRPLAAFFLPSPPSGLPPLKDFRKPHGVSATASSPELLAEIRLARSRRQTALSLAGDLGFEAPAFQAQATIADDPEEVGSRLRLVLNVPEAAQRNWASQTVALDTWRQALESLGVLIFKAKYLNKEEARGFSLSEQLLPVIVIASGDTQNGQVFTLMHEFAHLALRTAGVCDLTDLDEVERYCNHVSGAILVPASELLWDERVKRANKSTEWSDEDLDALSHFFSVSAEVVLRRLLIMKKTNRDFYSAKRAEYLKRYASQKGGFGRTEYEVKSARALGNLYASIVLDAYHREFITLADVSDYFDVKLKWIPGIERQIYAPRKD
jgi:Predicted Zn peptidase